MKKPVSTSNLEDTGFDLNAVATVGIRFIGLGTFPFVMGLLPFEITLAGIVFFIYATFVI